jgi:hypothetical protein
MVGKQAHWHTFQTSRLFVQELGICGYFPHEVCKAIYESNQPSKHYNRFKILIELEIKVPGVNL